MAIQDILNAAYGSENAANERMRGMPTITPDVPAPAAPPMMLPRVPEESGNNMASLIPLLLGGGQGGMQGGMRGGGQGLSSFDAGTGANAEIAQRIARYIENRAPGDFQVSGLEGWQGQGPISSGHVTNSQHYTGQAGDVSWQGGGGFGSEGNALDWLYNKLNNRWGDALTELIWRAPDHYDHLHYGVRPGG